MLSPSFFLPICRNCVSCPERDYEYLCLYQLRELLPRNDAIFNKYYNIYRDIMNRGSTLMK